MPWYVPVAVRILAAYVAGPFLLKPLAAWYAQAKLLLIQFGLCFAVALPMAAALGQLRFDWTIVAVGCGNGLAAYCYRKAIAISLSRTALFAFWDDLLAMGLSYAILHEGQFLNAGMLLGVVLSVGAVILFTVHGYQKEHRGKEAQEPLPKRLYLYAGAYSVMLGYRGILHALPGGEGHRDRDVPGELVWRGGGGRDPARLDPDGGGARPH
jgi:hypothetical protein